MEAVYLLNTVVDQCSSEVFLQHSEHWVKALLMIVQVIPSSRVFHGCHGLQPFPIPPIPCTLRPYLHLVKVIRCKSFSI